MEASAQTRAYRGRSSSTHRRGLPVPVETRAERVLISRWIQHQIVDWPSSHCFDCRRPEWLELVWDDSRARFHYDCEPVWRAEQEVAARRALWGRVTGEGRDK
jgi:hypothetical protein